jgi:membrane protease YdiL (CAAX protease family)
LIQGGVFTVSDETIAIENDQNRHLSKLLILAVLVLSIAAVTAPTLIELMLYDEYGYSKNSTITHVVLPGVWSAITLLIIVLAVRTRAVGDLDFIWYRWSRSEVLKTILLITAAPLVYYSTAFLIHRLGLPLRENLYFIADQKGLAFFITLTIFIAIIIPILEELFWRVYVFGALRRTFSGSIAWLSQGIIFGLVHFRPFGGFIPVLFFGLIAGSWRWRRRTLVPIILAHIAVNSLWCAARWPGWLDCTKVRITTNYVAKFLELSKPTGYDPNDDAREDYAKAIQLVVEFPEELKKAHQSYPTQWSREERQQAEAWVVSNTEALEHVENGAQKSSYWLEYEHNDSTVLSVLPRNLDKFRHLAYALCMRAELRTNQGDLKQGFSDVMCCYQLGEHLLRNKTLTSKLVASAVINLSVQTVQMILSNEEIKSIQLTRIQEKLETFAESNVVEFDFMEQRFICMDVIQRIFTDDGYGGGHIPRSAFNKRKLPNGEFESDIRNFASVSESDIRLWRKLERHRTTADVKQYYDLAEKAFLMSPWEYNKCFTFIKISIESFENRNPLIKTFAPAIGRLVEIKARFLANLDALITTLAILRYKADTQQLPVNLSELVTAGYLKTVPDDPFSAGSINYKLTNGGFILYSFGADFDDDAGTPSKWGYGEKGGDQVFWPLQEAAANSQAPTETQ